LIILTIHNCNFRFALRKNVANRNDVTKFFASIGKNIDRFHFGNHIDAWCIENCDSNKVRELDGVNTEVCEQLFNKVNSHRNCKSMNEAHYFMFWLYNIDMHNLDVEGMASSEPDPRSEYRWEKLKIIEADLTQLETIDTELELIVNGVEAVTISSKIEAPRFKCPDCGAGYETQGFLDRHSKKKHEGTLFWCEECKKILSTRRTLNDHIKKMHRTCKWCNPSI
jgi:hypothetical protein